MGDVHPHSVDSLHSLDNRQNRQEMILVVYKQSAKPLTDRQVKTALGFEDMNSVRPRITELIDAYPPKLQEVGETQDPVTRKTVRLVTIAKPGRQAELQFEKAKDWRYSDV